MRFVCPGCNQTLEVHDDWAGQPYQCSGCGQRMRVPGNVPREETFRPSEEYAERPRSPRRDDERYDDRRRSDDRYDDRGYDRREDRYDDDYDDYDRPRRYRRRSASDGEGQGIAVAGLVCGILGVALFCIPILAWILGALGIVFGSIGLSVAKDASTRGMAVAGLACGAAGIVVGIVIFIIALHHPIFWWGR
jgi:hypothetical protein